MGTKDLDSVACKLRNSCNGIVSLICKNPDRTIELEIIAGMMFASIQVQIDLLYKFAEIEAQAMEKEEDSRLSGGLGGPDSE